MNDHLQESIDSAWTLYSGELAEFIRSMPVGEHLKIVAETGVERGDGDSPWISLHSGSDDVVESFAVLDSYLYDGEEAGVGDDALLVELGWSIPAARTARGQMISRSMQTQKNGSTELARLIVRAFREGWRVPHPAFLTAFADDGDGRQFRTETDRQLPDITAVLPEDMDHLRALIRGTIGTSALHFRAAVEDNGDIRVDNFALPVHVCFGHDASAVRLHAPLVTGVVVTAALSRKLSWLNTRWKNITFVVAGNQLFAGIVVDTKTYIPRLLTSMIYRLGLFIDDIDASFASELGGTVFDPSHHHEGGLPAVTWSDDGGTLGTLRAACELTGGPVDIATVEALCRRQDLAELIERAHWTAARFGEHAHRLGDERKVRAAVLCDTMSAAWNHVAESLTRAHRPVAAATRRPEQIRLFDHLDQPALFDIR